MSTAADDSTEIAFVSPTVKEALDMLETAMTDQVTEKFKDEFEAENFNDTYLYMPTRCDGEECHPLDVVLQFDSEAVATLNVRTELIEKFSEDPEHHAVRIMATIKALRLLADDLEKLPLGGDDD